MRLRLLPESRCDARAGRGTPGPRCGGVLGRALQPGRASDRAIAAVSLRSSSKRRMLSSDTKTPILFPLRISAWPTHTPTSSPPAPKSPPPDRPMLGYLVRDQELSLFAAFVKLERQGLHHGAGPCGQLGAEVDPDRSDLGAHGRISGIMGEPRHIRQSTHFFD